ncbi:hypothetical protein P692DRAFT_201729926 [Suillus brevipes Sb2]|nr:hypothetical protein P692DRAFT_201729926 [Suillus brevipes Sb2]
MDITIEIPTRLKEDSFRSFSIPGFHYRPLVAMIRAAFADIQAGAFHLLPFQCIWKDPLDDHQERVFDELYSSDSWLEAQDNLHRQPQEPGCSFERVIAGLMFFSDATHLAMFGTAKAWPLYLYFGNLMKYARSAPKSGACHIVGFFPSVGDLPPVGMAALHAHCRRELFHACWKHLLDAEFMHAYRHGIVLQCPDGVYRRVFPRIFTYSADYPEKALIATIKDMGSCPSYCLESVVMAGSFIFSGGNTVNGSKVQVTLGKGSWVPTVVSVFGFDIFRTTNYLISNQNTFAEKLGPLGFDVFRMLIVDFMHECELGTWKALFTHLVRLLYALPGGDRLVAALDNRFVLHCFPDFM